MEGPGGRKGVIAGDRRAGGSGPPIGRGGGQGPFGWTGIRRERYTHWKGKLDPRWKVVLRMITSGVRFNGKGIGVVILIALGWIFSVLFPVLNAGFGGLTLEMDSGGGGFMIPEPEIGTSGNVISMHRQIANSSVARYELMGIAGTPETQYGISNIPMGWDARVNQTQGAGGPLAIFTVDPPDDATPGESANMTVTATSNRRIDQVETVTTIVPDHWPTEQHGVILITEDTVLEGEAGEDVVMDLRIWNSGTVDDWFNVSFHEVPAKWDVGASVDGVEVEVRMTEVQGPFGGQVSRSHHFSVELGPGQEANCTVTFDTPKETGDRNTLSIMVFSEGDPLVSWLQPITVNLEKTGKVDMTGAIVFQQIMGNQVLWALFLAAVVGSKMISTDMAEKSYNLYFARPITKDDYLVGKFGTVSVLLSLITMVPTLVAYGLIILLTETSDSYVWDHLWVWGAIIVHSLVVIVTFSTLSLTFSSLTERRFYAAAALVVVFIASTLMASIVSGAFGVEEGPLLSINDNFDILGKTLFDMEDELSIDFPWYYSLLVIVGLWAICTFIVWYKIHRTELSE